MYFGNTYGFEHQQILTGFFKSNSDVRHAREILTDYGYPKEAAEVIEVNNCSKLVASLGKHLLASIKKKSLLGIGLGIIVIFAGFALGARLFSQLSFYEIALTFAIWFALVLMGIAACGLIGALIAALVGPAITTAYSNQETTPKEKNVLISVAVRTPEDAQDIAREWSEIGGKVV